jgi:hypothetical protein
MRIIQEYIDYYYSKHQHQEIDQSVPMESKPQLHGRVQKIPILGGFCNNYVRRAE